VRPIAQFCKRYVRLLLLAAAAVTLSGCVYLRLLELKKQFAHFEQNFVVQPTEDFTLHCLHPVLTSSDLRWLGAEPKTITPWNNGEEWKIRWIKIPAPNTNEAFVYDMEFIARLVDGRLVEASIPKRYFAYFSKELFVNLLRSTGSAKVDRGDHQTEAQTETPAETALPNIKTIKGMLGGPTQQSTKAGQTVYLYRYRLDLAEPESKPAEVTFIFDPASGDLRRLMAHLPHGTLNYDFAKALPENKKAAR